tara:strand:- start:1018 stop:1302 length:285 start_codon:yes stop_codon:yes gene_type:complete
MFSVNAKTFEKRMKKLAKLPEFLMDEALEITKDNTPVASGNARRNTKKQSNKIISDYAYAGRLDDGYSKQAPKGFTKPTIEQLDDEANKYVRKI